MSEWWTYSLRDLLLFSPSTYYRLFELYNIEWWPLQIFALALGMIVLLLLRNGSDQARKAIAVILALCWLWLAWAYHWQRYASINWAASYYAAAFALEALLLLWLGVIRQPPGMAEARNKSGRSGMVLFVFALLAYPLLALLPGRSWTQAELFGMAPDPTALATLAIILLGSVRPAWWLLPIPVMWCLISGATLWAMASPDFWLPPLAALLASAMAISSARKFSGQT
ncbi:MAG: hypothetical protein B7Y56_03850 [Gallionellales bacterium 35-53-114]|jgi:hypothetical protein|nr:MAG: hypothetical protein B7Y56_03850 [Gallionellales bacterium 35-53-114]OYZ65234.1 MAG: hypothetical protein B7Y04_01010 [Gallionellales bacterium 24-53-125]OZB08140.1 MAG: hypothetical protein B7X61_11460 [Gallionellales bacterium 39-52-133]HQS58063.1 DUF6064 family protein [Gallionellaceae bacterium]HQS73618.1 DUF6064 family protein [Gallionellaceae bacterium]